MAVAFYFEYRTCSIYDYVYNHKYNLIKNTDYV